MNFTTPLHFLPNIRFEKASATTGYTWGKPASVSNILHALPATLRQTIDIVDDDIVAERWMVTDDRQFPSRVRDTDGTTQSLCELFESFGEQLLGPHHMKQWGPFLNVIMKQLDTNATPTKGSLSVQLHPKVGHPVRPAKPEMWKGTGSTYLGWNQDMTEEQITAAVERGTLEKYLNLITMDPEKLIVVSGGLIHAVRYDTFTAEWSKAPGRDDIAKGNIKDATVSPYDRTDGKTPRPGKENVDASLEVMRHAQTFTKTTESQLVSVRLLLWKDDHGNTVWQLFRTPEVWVDEYVLQSECTLELERGLPCYVESGAVFVRHAGEVVDELVAGDEVFFPYDMQQVTLERRGVHSAVMQMWYVPFTTGAVTQ